MKVVGTVVESQLVFFAIKRKLSLADTVAPSANKGREVGLVTAGELLNAVMSLNDVSYFAILIGDHNCTNGTSII